MTEVSPQAQPEPLRRNLPIEGLTLFGGRMETVDIQSERIASGKETPVLFAPGMFAGPRSYPYQNSMVKLEQTGRRVLSFDHPRHSDSLEDTFRSYIDMAREGFAGDEISADSIDGKIDFIKSRWKVLSEEYKYPRETLRRALHLLGFLEHKETDRADVVAHSEGGIDSVVAAFLNPDKIRNIVLVDTGGMIGKDTLSDMRKRSLDVDTRAEALPLNETDRDRDQAARAQLQAEIAAFAEYRPSAWDDRKSQVRYMASNPRRAYGEADAIARSPITPLLHILRKEGHKIGMIHAIGDEMFPLERIPGVAKHSSEFSPETIAHSHAHTDKFERDEEGKEIIDAVTGQRTLLEEGGSLDGVVSLQGVHNTLGGDPRFMGWADHLLTRFATQPEPLRRAA